MGQHDCFSNPRMGLEQIAEQFDGGALELRALIIDGEAERVVRPILAIPIDHI